MPNKAKREKRKTKFRKDRQAELRRAERIKEMRRERFYDGSSIGVNTAIAAALMTGARIR